MADGIATDDDRAVASRLIRYYYEFEEALRPVDKLIAVGRVEAACDLAGLCGYSASAGGVEIRLAVRDVVETWGPRPTDATPARKTHDEDTRAELAARLAALRSEREAGRQRAQRRREPTRRLVGPTVGPDRDVRASDLVPGAQICRYTRVNRDGAVVAAVPCHETQTLVVTGPDEGLTYRCLCRTCGRGFEVELVREFDGGWQAVFAIAADTVILTSSRTRA